MKRIFLFTSFILMMTGLAACQPSSPKAEEDQSDPKPPVSAEMVVETGIVKVGLKTPISEPLACIFPIQIGNGLEDPTSVTMIGFKVLGSGDDANGNMFAPAAEPGGISEARVIVEGQPCSAYDTLSIPEIRCTSGGENCAAKVNLIDGGGLKFSQTG